MAESRPTRWQKARKDWPGVRAKREIVVGLVAGVVAAGVQALVGSAGAVDTLIAAAIGVVVAVVVFPLAELGWAWLQAPMRLLTEDVIAIRERIEAVPVKEVSTKPRINVRATLLVHLRKGREITGLSIVRPEYVEQWTDDATEFLGEHLPAVAEGFLEATQNTGRLGVEERIAYLQQVADGMKDEQ